MKDPQRRQRVTRRRTPHPPATPSARARRGADVAARGYSLSAPTTPVLAVGGYAGYTRVSTLSAFRVCMSVCMRERAQNVLCVIGIHGACVVGAPVDSGIYYSC